MTTLSYRAKNDTIICEEQLRTNNQQHQYHSSKNNNSKISQQPNLNNRETSSSSPFAITTNHHHYNQIFTKMNSTLLIAFICLQLALVYFHQVNSLKCYNCSSVIDSACDESFDITNRTTIDCADDVYIKTANKPAKLCRKLVQHVESRKIVTRSCGWIDHTDINNKTEQKDICVKRSGTFAVMMESCACYSDGCNHSANLVPNNILIFTILTILATSSWFIKSKNNINLY